MQGVPGSSPGASTNQFHLVKIPTLLQNCAGRIDVDTKYLFAIAAEADVKDGVDRARRGGSRRS
jgi:hypothetical protein